MSLILGKFRLIANRCSKFAPMLRLHIRQSSFKSSPFVCDLEDVQTKYEVTKLPEEWKYVERILPPITVPIPSLKAEYQSEWKPQQKNANDLPYYVSRNKNHMIPVYLKTMQRGIKRHTYVKKINGDIWLLERELRDFLQQDTKVPIRSQVNELVGYICFNGDHVNAVKYWLMKKNL